MHGCSPESVLLVNAEVDSMGGVIDGGVGLDNKTSPRRAAIEKAQAELRLEYDVREERKRELEFLEKGGNPLDFKLGPATSISFHSTSVTDQLVTSEAKNSFPCTASPHGDSVESSGRPGAPTCHETNSADNLFLYEGENDTVEGERNNRCRGRNNITPSEQFSQLDACNSLKESDDSGMFRFVVKSQAYARRNRSRSCRDNAWVSSSELASVGDGDGSRALPSTRYSSRDAKGSLSETKYQKDRTVSSVCNSKSTSPNGNVVVKNAISDNRKDRNLDGPQVHGSNCGLTEGGEVDLDVAISKDSLDGKHIVHRQDYAEPVPNVTVTEATCLVDGRLDAVSPGVDCVPGAAPVMMETVSNAGQTNKFAIAPKDVKSLLKEGSGNIAAFSRKDNLDSESCIRSIHAFERNTLTDQSHCLRTSNLHGNCNRQVSEIDEAPVGPVAGTVKLNREANDDQGSVFPSPKNDGFSVKVENIYDRKTGSKDERNPPLKIIESDDPIVLETSGKLDSVLDDSSNLRNDSQCHLGRDPSTKKSSKCELLEANHSGRTLTSVHEIQTSTESQLKVATKAHEDSTLEEARIIEAKRKRIAELSVGSFPLEYRRKSHWDFVLEEMAWLANDLTQERVWKTTAAAQLARFAATGARSRFDKQNLCLKQKKIAYTLAKAVMQFWRSAEVLLNNDGSTIGHTNGDLTLVKSHKANEDGEVEEEKKYFEKQNTGKNTQVALQGYGVRFLKYSGSLDCSIEAEAPVTPDRMFDSGVVDISCEDQFSRESLFYTIPPGAMEEYRKSMELYWSQNEKTGGNMDQEEVDTSTYDNVPEYYYEEEEREMGAYYLHGAFDGRKSTKHMQKKRKGLQNSYVRSYEVGADLPYGYGQFNENKVGNQSPSLMGKRPSNLNVGPIPTKRVRTAAARQRVLCPFSSGAVGGVPMTSKTDASSGDTSSFQDDQSTIVGGSQIRKNMEIESTGEFERQTPFDGSEVSTKPKKKKRPKQMVYKNSLNSSDIGGLVIGQGTMYEQRWQLDSMVQNEQREFSKKRLESRAFESNGNSSPFAQHAAKRPKTMKQLHDTSPESITPMAGSIHSPVASQMSNLSNPNKFMRMIAGRDRGGRKNKGLKLPSGLSGSGSQWSTFEDQALVVLVHDMGPNWELVSDAINSTLQFKCIFRKPKECKERHKFLMDKNAGDGADSAEDSGSSQPYPSTLPGIPKGSARQLFQRLQGPMEEDTLKAHFEKIIFIGQKLHSRINKDQKQITPVHNSHVVSLSHVCPNNLNGVTLTPRDLCDATTSNSDILSLGCQNSHNSGLTLQNQGPLAPTLPTSGANPLLQGSSGTVLNNSSPSSALNVLTRDGQRYNMPRPPSLPIDEHHKMQRYNQMLSSRNIQHSGLTASGSLPNDRGVRILPGGSGMGMMSGLNRGLLPRPGYQGMGSPAMLNMVSSGSMLSSNGLGLGMANPANMHNGTVSSQGNHMIRTREALHMMRNSEDQRQMMMQELQMQVTQGNGQGIPAFNGISTGFSNATVSAPVQSFSVQQQQPMAPQQSYVLNNTHHHLQGGSSQASNPQQQAILFRLAKEKNQQRILQQQQQQHHQFATSNPSIHHAPPPQSQHAISSIPNNSQIQQQASPQPPSLPSSSSPLPLTSSASPLVPTSSQFQQKHHLPPNGLGRNMAAGGGSLPNQMLKQRQRQQQQQQQQHLQQPSRQHPQQRPQSQTQQPAKVMKGMGRGNMMVHQNLPIDASSVNGLASGPGNQGTEKSDQSVHLMSAQGAFSGACSPAVHSSKSSAHLQPSNQSSPPQKMVPGSPSPSSKQHPQLSSHQENSNQGQVSPASSGSTLLTPHQPGLPLTVACQQQQQQQQTPQRQLGQSQLAGLRMLQQNCQVNTDRPVQSSVDHDHVPVNNTFQMATTLSPVQCTGESTGVVASISPTSAHSHWKSSETLFDSGTPTSTSHLASISNATLPSSAGGGPLSLPSQGLMQRQLSASIPKHGHNVGAQWQPPSQQQMLQPPPAPPQQSPPPVALQQHSPPSHQSQTPQQHLQSGQTVQYSRPANSGSG